MLLNDANAEPSTLQHRSRFEIVFDGKYASHS